MKLKIGYFVLKCPLDFYFEFRNKFHERRRAGLDFENAVTCHSWSKRYLLPFGSSSSVTFPCIPHEHIHNTTTLSVFKLTWNPFSLKKPPSKWPLSLWHLCGSISAAVVVYLVGFFCFSCCCCLPSGIFLFQLLLFTYWDFSVPATAVVYLVGFFSFCVICHMVLHFMESMRLKKKRRTL